MVAIRKFPQAHSGNKPFNLGNNSLVNIQSLQIADRESFLLGTMVGTRHHSWKMSSDAHSSEIDSEYGDFSGDIVQAQRFRSDTLDFVRTCLGVECQSEPKTHPNLIIESFRGIGQEIRNGYSPRESISEPCLLAHSLFKSWDKKIISNLVLTPHRSMRTILL